MTEHLIASTLTALAAIGAANLLRHRSAKFRFAIILAGLLRFAIPTSWLSGAGERLAQTVPAYIDTGITRLLWIPSLPALSVDWLVAAAWLGGSLACLVLSIRRWMPRLDAVRPPEAEERDKVLAVWDRLGIRQRVDVRIVAYDQVPAACGVFRPFIALPDGLAAALNPAELDAVLAHELAHVARRDNLSAALVRLVVCAFWFHPLVWWIERRLLAERETACDEFVLAHGAAPQDYVTGIAKVCRITFAAPPAFAGITGSNLKSRAAHILTVDLKRVFGGRGRWAPAAFGMAAALVPMGAGFLAARPPLQEQLRVALAEGRTVRAIAILEERLGADPLNEDLRVQLGNLYMRQERYDAAIGVFEQLLYDHPDSGDLLFRLAEANRRAGWLDKALELFERAAHADPFRPDAYLQQALLLEGAGQRNRAKPVYERVLEMKPGHPIAANNLAYMLVEEGGDPKRALELALAAYRQMPDSADVADTLGVVYLKNEMPDHALAAFHAALMHRFDSAMVRGHLLEALDAASPLTPEMEELRALLRGPMRTSSELRIQRLVSSLPVLP